MERRSFLKASVAAAALSVVPAGALLARAFDRRERDELQRLVDEAGARGGGLVQIERDKVYRMSAPLEMRSGVHLSGARIRAEHDGTAIQFGMGCEHARVSRCQIDMRGGRLAGFGVSNFCPVAA